MATVRTRFAPSPTGSLHVGGARTALFNHLYARKHGGTFVLRIEDTDAARSTHASEEAILRDLKWLGIEWDEGPEKEGPFAPYRQTDRARFYRDALKLLQDKDLIYRCYCTEEELEAKRKAALAAGETPRYDGRCRFLSGAETWKLESEGKSFAWRFRVSGRDEKVVVRDLVRGDVTFDTNLIGGDFVLMKSNGLPSYNFACVVDDHAMEITHVIRGDEHLTNTPRQILLYEALEWNLPAFAHLSMILAPDHTKLSKRHGTTAVIEFRDKGFLPHAIVNYIALLGWSPKEEREIFLPAGEYSDARAALAALIGELSRLFSLESVMKNPAVFDNQKLSWMNAQYIRLLKPADLVAPLETFLGNPPPLPREKLTAILSTQRHNFETLAAAAEHVRTFFLPGAVELEDAAREVSGWPESGEVLAVFENEIRSAGEIGPEGIAALMSAVQKGSGKKGKALYWPIRVALTGKTHGPELVHLLPVLGREEILNRIEKTRSWFVPVKS